MADVSDLFAFLDQLEATDKALRIAATTTHTKQKDRIFGKGQDQNGGQIGSYSRKPTYISNRQSPRRLSGRGKTGRTATKAGKPHTSTYFEQGYYEFRSAAGRQNSFVDLRLSGAMETDYKIEAQGVKYVAGFTNRSHYAKAEGNEDRFKKAIFGLSADEEQLFAEIFESEMFGP